MDNIKDLKDAVEKYGNMPTENAFEYKTETNIPKPKSPMEEMYEWLTVGGGYEHCEQIVLDRAEELVEKEKERLTEDQWLEKLMNELPEHGIDTSEWEYKYGDNSYTAAEFLARCIKGYNPKND